MNNQQQKNKHLELLFQQPYQGQLQSKHILIVGVGGIGCELLKCLTKSGFRYFTLIDLDTIEFSNLNRQFYFRKNHIKQSKAEVAKQEILKYSPDCIIESYCENLFSSQFDNQFFQKFAIIFNALDNQEARRYLGRKCIENNKIMIDAGTGGYNGQVQTNIRHLNQCNNCKPMVKQQTFNVCSIRDQPSEPIHCVVWAKNLFGMIFGPQDKDIENEDDDQEISEKDPVLEQSTIGGVFTKNIKDYKENEFEDLGIALFNKIFYNNIQSKLRLQNQDNSNNNMDIEENQQDNNALVKIIKNPSKNQVKSTLSPLKFDPNNLQNKIDPQFYTQDEQVKSISEYSQIFVYCFVQIMKERQSQLPNVFYDKDDILSHNFVAAATNIRIHNFRNPQNPLKLQYISARKIKEMNIIHAIGSTNAIAAACQVQECIKEKPKIDCQICSYKIHYLKFQVQFSKHTLKQIRQILQTQFLLEENSHYIQCLNTNTRIFEASEEKFYQLRYEEISNKIMKNFVGSNASTDLIELEVDNNQFLYRVSLQNNNDIDNIIVLTDPMQVQKEQKQFKLNIYEQEQNKKKYLYQLYGY